MLCPYCDHEMEKGKISLYEYGSFILKMPATLKFTPENKAVGVKKADQTYKEPEGYYCKKCDRIIASFAVAKPIF